MGVVKRLRNEEEIKNENTGEGRRKIKEEEQREVGEKSAHVVWISLKVRENNGLINKLIEHCYKLNGGHPVVWQNRNIYIYLYLFIYLFTSIHNNIPQQWETTTYYLIFVWLCIIS